MTLRRAALAVAATTLLTACGPDAPPPHNTPPPYTDSPPSSWQPADGPPPPGSVVFEITGVGVAQTISYGAGPVATTLPDVELPWSGTAHTDPSGTSNAVALTLQAQLPSGGTGPLTCRITLDGKVLKTATQAGAVLCTTNTLW